MEKRPGHFYPVFQPRISSTWCQTVVWRKRYWLKTRPLHHLAERYCVGQIRVATSASDRRDRGHPPEPRTTTTRKRSKDALQRPASTSGLVRPPRDPVQNRLQPHQRLQAQHHHQWRRPRDHWRHYRCRGQSRRQRWYWQQAAVYHERHNAERRQGSGVVQNTPISPGTATIITAILEAIGMETGTGIMDLLASCVSWFSLHSACV